jgi:hypothetical protein
VNFTQSVRAGTSVPAREDADARFTEDEVEKRKANRQRADGDDPDDLG